MNLTKKTVLVILSILSYYASGINVDSIPDTNDSVNSWMMQDYKQKLEEIEKQRLEDSIKKAELEFQISTLRTQDDIQKTKLRHQLDSLQQIEQQRFKEKQEKINSMRANATGYPVVGLYDDTLFFIYTKFGAARPKERAENTSRRIHKLFDDPFLVIDSLSYVETEYSTDIVYGETILMSISETDAMWQNTSRQQLAGEYAAAIKRNLLMAKDESRLSKALIRIGLVILVLVIIFLLFWLAGKAYKKMIRFFEAHKDKWLKNLAYKDYTFLTADQEFKVILFLLKTFRWIVYALLLYIAIPLIFSIFPFTRGWADYLFGLFWSPFRGIFVALWEYLPNLFSILVIYFVMRYFIKFVKYIFGEIETEKLKLSGFHADWAMPTYSIVRFLLYAFMFVLIFPYLPGSDSDIFKGVSVFIGILFSLGSSTAIANIIAGLVITYMRPFKIGDRIKIGEVFGDVIEKTLLVTRVKTPKNEVITIPNASVLSGNTINYTSEAKNYGLILHTTVTIGYDVPWKKMHEALIEAAYRTEMVLKEPKPFVLQTSLDDFYVSYQINAYTRDVNKQAVIYSNLHQNIQDVCNEHSIEILSPHYRAARDGNSTTIPAGYLPEDYKAPTFKIETKNSVTQ